MSAPVSGTVALYAIENIPETLSTLHLNIPVKLFAVTIAVLNPKHVLHLCIRTIFKVLSNKLNKCFLAPE